MNAALGEGDSDAALYVHIPFCETKCPYCDFNSFPVEGRDVDGYLDALLREFDARGLPRRPGSIFIGGGTPTVIEPERIARYLCAITAAIEPDPAREFTVEANPGTLTAEKVAVLAEHGVNRLSIGAQSIYDRHLATLGRVHVATEIEEALRLAHGGGLTRVSLDFIYAFPGLSMSQWNATLDRAIGWGLRHLSCYALTFEAGTEFHARLRAGRMSRAEERIDLAMFRFTERKLRHAGLERYEISNFAVPGEECKHNLNYWRNGAYAGYGAGSFSYLGGRRSSNERHLGRYAEAVMAAGHATVFEERLPAPDAARETLVFGLRTRHGADLEVIRVRHGIDLGPALSPTLARLVKAGYLAVEGSQVRLARRGWRVADAVAGELLA